MSDKNHYLVSFENVSASVGGMDISSIVELQLSAVANDIPQITLLVDAGHTSGGKPQAAAAMSLSAARRLFDGCRAMVKSSAATLSLSLTCRARGPAGDDTQSLNINGWLLSDVSFSPIQEGGVCTVALTFMHPACKAHFGGAVPGLLATEPKFSGLEGGNPLEVFLSALRIYGSEAERLEPRAPDAGGVRDNLIDRLSQAADALESSVHWSGGGLPAEAQLGSWEDLLRYGLTIYAMPSGGTSVFQRFAKSLVPECSLAIGGDYTSGSLEVGPFRPWSGASASISDSDIISLQFPQNDPSPISGVKLTSYVASDTYQDSFHTDTSQTNVKPSDIFYVPSSELGAEFLYGPVQQFNEPGWMSLMHSFLMPRSDTGAADVTSLFSDNLQLAVSTPRDGAVASFTAAGSVLPALEYSEAMMACAKAYYETSLMKDWQFSVTTRFLFSSGGVLCPGRVLSVRSDGGEVLGGYIVSVVHSISVANRSAHTTVTCTHPRFGALPEGVSGSENALYD